MEIKQGSLVYIHLLEGDSRNMPSSLQYGKHFARVIDIEGELARVSTFEVTEEEIGIKQTVSFITWLPIWRLEPYEDYVKRQKN